MADNMLLFGPLIQFRRPVVAPPPTNPQLHTTPPGLELTQRANLLANNIEEIAAWPDYSTVNQEDAGAGHGTWNNQPWYNHNQSNQWQNYYADTDSDESMADMAGNWNARPRWNEPDTDTSEQWPNAWWNYHSNRWQTQDQENWY